MTPQEEKLGPVKTCGGGGGGGGETAGRPGAAHRGGLGNAVTASRRNRYRPEEASPWHGADVGALGRLSPGTASPQSLRGNPSVAWAAAPRALCRFSQPPGRGAGVRRAGELQRSLRCGPGSRRGAHAAATRSRNLGGNRSGGAGCYSILCCGENSKALGQKGWVFLPPCASVSVKYPSVG